MQRQHVASSNLHSVGYDPQSQTLEIEFHNGVVYQYSGVPPVVHRDLISAGSKGTYFSAFIKERYPTRRLR